MILMHFIVVIIPFYTFNVSNICILFLKMATWLAETCRSLFYIKIIVVLSKFLHQLMHNFFKKEY